MVTRKSVFVTAALGAAAIVGAAMTSGVSRESGLPEIEIAQFKPFGGVNKLFERYSYETDLSNEQKKVVEDYRATFGPSGPIFASLLE